MEDGYLFPKSLDETIAEVLDLYDLPMRILPYVKRYLSGEIPEQSLVCCHSGCDPCNETIYNALQTIKKRLGQS
ncbi:hypothetical protein [Leptospira sp. GIMC2001]|uniref:hypothetical protein n=1 Tax=Leptospira sp. GIMC2001 TaxID=1513297 RepID=UPI0023490CD1|nr:hypothetical protein [Leptospira sp. GIMC2001]WCL51364.1 hypothetical protein O4O04_12875 [Leptospira sp. GIMC2001]